MAPPLAVLAESFLPKDHIAVRMPVACRTRNVGRPIGGAEQRNRHPRRVGAVVLVRRYGHGAYSYALCIHGLYDYGLYRPVLANIVPVSCSDGLCSYGLHVIAYIVMVSPLEL